MRTACLITTCCKTEFQETLLKRCVQSVQQYHPDAHCIVLNDNSEIDIRKSLWSDSSISIKHLRIEETEFRSCGEVNPYAWSIRHSTEYDLFFYLHDSVLLHGRLPLEPYPVHYRPLWYASPWFSIVGLLEKPMDTIMHDFQIDGKSCSKDYDEMIQRNIYVVFGGMAIWTPIFAQSLRDRTNFLQMASQFNKRAIRCLFERVLYVIFKHFHRPDYVHNFTQYAICGDIYAHRKAFTNTELDPEAARNPYALKVWQGR